MEAPLPVDSAGTRRGGGRSGPGPPHPAPGGGSGQPPLLLAGDGAGGGGEGGGEMENRERRQRRERFLFWGPPLATATALKRAVTAARRGAGRRGSLAGSGVTPESPWRGRSGKGRGGERR
ncbi:hypothetical protein PVAP13_2NG222012 [Panicum virgatum]|uniref:Uncharacterized protein n=1 Tax=Panicum virgatum TaxID=38727 RepID=A0A8T0VDN0_PANVG|nr:hypothetical protein PVAP13_2NG222012 [Panicum virgatum]